MKPQCNETGVADFEKWVSGYPQLEKELRLLLFYDRAIGDAFAMSAFVSNGSQGSVFKKPSRDIKPGQSVGLARYRAGQQIAGYKLTKPIGSGGMGEVWEAIEVSMGRKVALKLVLPHLLDSASMERLSRLSRREAIAGGLSVHPSIVTTLAHGTDEGLSWISQELVEGSWTVKDLLDDLRAGEALPKDYYRQAAQFVVQVAGGLQAAHDAGVIHRDVKPQNILIAPDETPRITDFGLARVAEDSFLSHSGDFAGTYAYMSPEQVTAKRIGLDHRTDIFSLGIVLYEMLSLQRPFDGDTTHQIAQKIIFWDPPKLQKLKSKLPIDLAVIAGKALEKRVGDRYQSMQELADDLKRFLANEPIAARPPGPIRRTRKWLERNPTFCTAVGLSMIAIGVILAVELGRQNAVRGRSEMEVRASELKGEAEKMAKVNLALGQARDIVVGEKELALKESRRMRLFVEFQEGLFHKLDPQAFGERIRGQLEASAGTGSNSDGKESLSAGLGQLNPWGGINFTNIGVEAIKSEILDPAKAIALSGFDDDPLLGANIQYSLAGAYQKLGAYPPALELSVDSMNTRVLMLGEESAASVSSMLQVAELRVAMGKLDQALPTLENVYLLRKRENGTNSPVTIQSANLLASVLKDTGRLEDGRRILDEVLASSSNSLDVSQLDLNSLKANLSTVLMDMGDYEGARRVAEEIVDSYQRSLPPDHPNLIEAQSNLGIMLARIGKNETAKPLLEWVLDARRRSFGDLHSLTLDSANNLGAVLQMLGELDQASALLKEVYEGRLKVLGIRHPDTLYALTGLSSTLEAMGNLEQSEELLVSGLSVGREMLGPEHPIVMAQMHRLGSVLMKQGKFEQSEELLVSGLSVGRKILGDEHPIVLRQMDRLGVVFMNLGKFEAAGTLFQKCMEGRIRMLGTDHPDTKASETRLVEFEENRRENEKAHQSED